MAKRKRLKDLKKSKDVYFRRRAKDQSLAPVTDLNAEIRQKVKTAKGTKREIKNIENALRSEERKNRAIRKERKELKARFEFEDEIGKAIIEENLRKPDYKTKDLSEIKNRLRAAQGKNFDFTVDDGFKKYKVNTKTLKKIWKKGGDASIVILKKMQTNTDESLEFYKATLAKEKKTAPKSRIKKLNRIIKGLEKKLAYTIKQNIEAIETGDLSELDEISDEDEKAYSILFKVVGNRIDRIGI